MKITIKREFDGKYYVGSAAYLPGCYVQSRSGMEIPAFIRKAISLYQKSYQSRNQSLPMEEDHPILNIKIRFDCISTEQIRNILKTHNFHKEYEDQDSLLMVNSNFPFDRVHLPQSDDISPLIVQKIFGKGNTIYVRNVKKKDSRNAV